MDGEDVPLDPDAEALLKNRGEFFGQVGGDVGEEVHGVIPPMGRMTPPSNQPPQQNLWVTSGSGKRPIA